MQRISAVIGKNFGDEGKGQMVHSLTFSDKKSLVVKHNGGAQAGHTVEEQDKRFVFHQLSSGSMNKADTLWANTYFPDLYKLEEEIVDFKNLMGFVPKIYCEANTPVVFVDDVLINMAIETLRDQNRHGSCGMGINEAKLRTEAGYGITVGQIMSWSSEELVGQMRRIREEYTISRMRELGITEEEEDIEEYRVLLSLEEVLWNAAEAMIENLKYVNAVDDMVTFLTNYEVIVFETGQGLLLDEDNLKYAPHLTSSKTGLCNIVKFLNRVELTLDDVYYVSRTYLTKHGAGDFEGECEKEQLGNLDIDKTNMPNPWQGNIRYGRHGSVMTFVEDVKKDIRYLEELTNPGEVKVKLKLTHLDETNQHICLQDRDYTVSEFKDMKEIQDVFNEIVMQKKAVRHFWCELPLLVL